jgi:hypothetical protein
MDHNAMIVAAPYLTADQIEEPSHQHACGALLCTAFVHRTREVRAGELLEAGPD